MQLNVPPDVEAQVQKQLITGAFANAEDVIRRGLDSFQLTQKAIFDYRRQFQ